jgi:hypothetical protein
MRPFTLPGFSTSFVSTRGRKLGMTLAIVDGPTIAQGESLSDGADCSAGDIVRITVPQEFTEANLTFQVSSDGNLYNDLYDARGNEVTVTAKPDTGIVIQGEVWGRSINFLKLRSGTREHPVVQRDECKFAIAIETPTGAAAAEAMKGPGRR